MTEFASLWDEASRDLDAEASLVSLTAARVAAAPVWPFFAAAVDEVNLAHRMNYAEPRLAKAAGFQPELQAQLHASLWKDWETLRDERLASLKAEAVAKCAECGHKDAGHAEGNPCRCGCQTYRPARAGSRTFQIIEVTAAFGHDDDDKDSDDSDSKDDSDDDSKDDSGGSSYYVQDKDTGKDIGGPYGSSADAKDAIDAGDFDEDSSDMSVTKGDSGGDSDKSDDDDDDDKKDSGNPFAKKDSAKQAAWGDYLQGPDPTRAGPRSFEDTHPMSRSHPFVELHQGDRQCGACGVDVSQHARHALQPGANPSPAAGDYLASLHTAEEHGGYHIEGSGDSCYVVNHIGERKNKKPMSHADALKYQRALMVNVPGARSDAEKHERNGDKGKHSARTAGSSWSDLPRGTYAPSRDPQELDILNHIAERDPDGGSVEPTRAMYDAHRNWVIDRYGHDMWQRYKHTNWAHSSADEPYHTESALHPIYALAEGEDPLEWIQQVAPKGQGEAEKPVEAGIEAIESSRRALAAAFREAGLDPTQAA